MTFGRMRINTCWQILATCIRKHVMAEHHCHVDASRYGLSVGQPACLYIYSAGRLALAILVKTTRTGPYLS